MHARAHVPCTVCCSESLPSITSQVKILYREYGDNVKIVGLADHSASVEDPNGLDRTELLRLVHESLPLSEYSAAGTQSTHTCECTTAPQSLRAYCAAQRIFAAQCRSTFVCFRRAALCV